MNPIEPPAPVHFHLQHPTGVAIDDGQVATRVRFEPLPSPEDLAPLMLAAYHGTPDDEGETLEDTVDVIRSTIDGGFGPWITEASFLAFDVGTDGPVGAIFVAREQDGTPFIAFVFTHPERTRRGVASALIAHVCCILSEVGQPELRLWVNAANEQALRLYRRLGFTDVLV